MNSIWIILADGVIKTKGMINLYDTMVGLLIFLVYSVFAIRWGMRFIDGRFAWLEQPNHKTVKMVVAIVLGYFLAGFYFVFWCVKMLVVVLPKWLG